LNESHHGLDEVKTRILESIAKAVALGIVPRGTIICLKIWKAGLEIWADWQERLPVSFVSAEESITSTCIPGYVAPLQRYGSIGYCAVSYR
jgi:hypothetical protein